MGQRNEWGNERRAFDGTREGALERALAAVEAMGETDAVVVPATPSPAMLSAGARGGGVSEDIAARVYRAMILAGFR
jgi:hypothetical protein